jgi:hypothetical protein
MMKSGVHLLAVLVLVYPSYTNTLTPLGQAKDKRGYSKSPWSISASENPPLGLKYTRQWQEDNAIVGVSCHEVCRHSFID